MVIKIQDYNANLPTPPGKLAEAEIHFTDGPLAGLKLLGFGIWEQRHTARRLVTFPARNYVVNGDRRAFALLRPIADIHAQDQIRDLILQAYEEYITALENPQPPAPASAPTRTL